MGIRDRPSPFFLAVLPENHSYEIKTFFKIRVHIRLYVIYIYIRYRYNTCACIYVHRQKGKERKEREREKRRKRRKRGIKSKKRKTRLGSPVFVGAGGSCLGVITPSFRDFNKREDE